jgi:hypothetical protein
MTDRRLLKIFIESTTSRFFFSNPLQFSAPGVQNNLCIVANSR